MNDFSSGKQQSSRSMVAENPLHRSCVGGVRPFFAMNPRASVLSRLKSSVPLALPVLLIPDSKRGSLAKPVAHYPKSQRGQSTSFSVVASTDTGSLESLNHDSPCQLFSNSTLFSRRNFLHGVAHQSHSSLSFHGTHRQPHGMSF